MRTIESTRKCNPCSKTICPSNWSLVLKRHVNSWHIWWKNAIDVLSDLLIAFNASYHSVLLKQFNFYFAKLQTSHAWKITWPNKSSILKLILINRNIFFDCNLQNSWPLLLLSGIIYRDWFTVADGDSIGRHSTNTQLSFWNLCPLSFYIA